MRRSLYDSAKIRLSQHSFNVLSYLRQTAKCSLRKTNSIIEKNQQVNQM